MNRSNATYWISEYVHCILAECSSDSLSELHFKALGEYSLLLTILRSHSPNEWRLILDSPKFKKVASRIRTSCNFRSESLEHCQLAQFLAIALDQDFLPRGDILETIKKPPASNLVSLEHYYLMEVAGLQGAPDFWMDATLAFLSNAFTHGVNIADQYQMTHLIFFSTDFGRREMAAPYAQQRILLQIIDRSLELAIKDVNCDLVAELCISGLLIDSNFLASSLAQNSLALLAESQREEGWLMPDYSAYQDSTQPNPNERGNVQYALFHTTCVAIVLDTLMRKCNAKWPNNSFQRTGKMLRILPSAELQR